MRIVTWNCNGGFRKKFRSLSDFAADLIVIQECENPAKSKDALYRDWASNYLWTGDNASKGLGIFAAHNISLVKNEWESQELKYFLSCHVNGRFNLVAIWCHGVTEGYQYIGQLWRYVQIHSAKLGGSVLAGDLNSNAIWDKPGRVWNHSRVIDELKRLGIESIYHAVTNEQQGQETKPTFFLQRKTTKPYHIDYVFCSKICLDNGVSVSIGDSDKWLSMSDHLPIVVDLNYC